MALNKNYAKRVPVSAVFTVLGEDDTAGVFAEEGIGAIEGNIAITRLSIVVVESFGAGASVAQLTDTSAAGDVNWLTADVPLDTAAGTTVIVEDFSPTTATIAPVFRPGKTLWSVNLSTAGSTLGELMIVIEYTQLDTEPGLSSSTNVPA